MKKRNLVQLCIVLLLIFVFAPIRNVHAEGSRPNYLWGEVSYDDYSEVTDENMETYQPKDCDTHVITLDGNYKLHIEIILDSTVEMDDGQDGYISLGISQGELSKEFYDNIHLSNNGCKNNIIDVELEEGTYQLQVGFIQGNVDTINYEIDLEYTRINTKSEVANDNATISFVSKSYSLTMDESYYYDENSFDFFDEVLIKSDLEYMATDISWKSSNKNIASVDKEGSVTAQAPGTITLTATLPNGNKASCKIIIPKPTYKISKTKSSLYVGSSVALGVNANPADQKVTVKWASSNKSIASVSSSGKVTGKKAGKCTITATLDNGKILNCYINVTVKAEIVDISDYLKDPSTLTKKQNKSFSFEYNSGKITYAKITGSNASFRGLKPGGMNIANIAMMDYDLIKTETVFLGQISYYKKKSTGEEVRITEVLLSISEIEYFNE